ncbi:sugar phosphate isomerase/epimerase family protein [Crystallibacter degradans]|uniref:sugar phosphate isomerase/epimerase family protein n=1 Tax=Crystallibacter degradans TaxID=2726743 RepID=UPI001472FC43|nr:sugar phosphate isomerase/epimerase family protein [Arthrobacter sp. SF27]NMR29074.1 sugar phosphate isomerase/epimerase [Arthrobacter sp. SF27]
MSFHLSLNTGTTRDITLCDAVGVTAEAGLEYIGVWRNRVAEAGLENAAKMIADAGLKVSSLCRGGFLTAGDEAGQKAALEDNRAAIVEAATLGTRELIMVVGGLPAAAHVLGGRGDHNDKDIVGARARVADRLAELVPFAREHNVRLVLEALHPMYVADRAVLSTLKQALDLAAPHPADTVGVVVDTFHVFWDPELEEQIARAGREGRLASYQVCDFNLPIASDALLSRGMMGDGIIDFASISSWVAAAGYTGPVEVEIFNQEVFDQDPTLTVKTMKERWEDLVLPALEGRG